MITHDSWQRIKEIFQHAQGLAPDERPDYLAKACGDDQSLREEVEALLTADAGNDDFLIAPAYEFAAGMLADQTEFSPGQKVGRYTILCLLGAGGMGQIYLAQDPQLGRKIALKLISPEFASDGRRVFRFEQEARASSALNHPNICVIHEIGTTESGRHFIAMEHIQGATVRDRLSRGAFSFSETLNVALQVAAALATAHATGIVHRDIKPENIMVRPDGYVKVLDFGLAKLLEFPADRDGWSRSSTNVRTEAGTLMGTVKYMSPEQLRETEVDERADIWSLGVVLYEMLTNSTPFEARTLSDTIAQIVSPQRAPLKFPAEVPARVQEIVTKALSKDLSARYQTITKLASDLRKVQREWQRADETDSALVLRPPVLDQLTRQFTRIKSQAVFTADFLMGEIRSHKTVATFAGIASVLVLLFILPNLLRPNPSTVLVGNRLTHLGSTVQSAISSDGKLVAHAEQAEGRQRVMLTSTANFSSRVLVEPADVTYLGITFSRDSNDLYLTRRENDRSILYRLALPGASMVKVMENVDSPITFSPDGNQVAFVRLNSGASEYYLVVAKLDGSNERVIANRNKGDTLSVYGAAWSPDGHTIVCPAGTWRQGFHMTLIGFDANSGAEHPLEDRSWFSILQVAWMDDMSGLVISARERPTSQHQLWRITYPDAVVRRLTNDLSEYEGVSLAGENIATVRVNRSWQMWVTSVDNSAPPVQITTGNGFPHGMTWTPAGKIVYSSAAQERLNLLQVDPDGSNPDQLPLNVGDNYNPVASPDGRYILFSSNRKGSFNIWRVNSADGSELKQLTFTDGNFYPAVSSDSQWVAYDQQIDLKLSIWRVPLEGGESTKLIEGYRMPAISPNNQLVAGRYDRESGTRDIAIFPSQGGKAIKNVGNIPVIEWQRIQWINNHTFSFINNVGGFADIWSYDLDTGEMKKLTNFNTEQILAYAWSPDHKQIACQRGSTISDVTILNPTPQQQ
jgi:serine/threonine protein kinase